MTPTRRSAAVFALKAAALRVRRATQDRMAGLERHSQARLEEGRFSRVLAESRTPLWTDPALAERRLQRGKVHNLRAAVRRLDGTVVPARAVFSFWKQIGRATARRGYVAGRELREGCLIPAIGGGLCQLSNALYDAALRAGCRIRERHPHTRVIPGSAAAIGRDATVAWNYIDLRFDAPVPVAIEAYLTATELIVRLRTDAPAPSTRRTDLPVLQTGPPPLDVAAHSCGRCDVGDCFRQIPPPDPDEDDDETAFLLDERWPEFARFRRDGDRIARRAALPFALRTRFLARIDAPPSRRRGVQLARSAALARALARHVATPEKTHLVVAQSFLPTLWIDGHLGGRTFDVVMTRLPLAVLHSRLDAAFIAYPDRTQLGDFRAPDALVRAEAAALAAARRIVTPHAEIAGLFPDRAERLDWHPARAEPRATVRGRAVVFPGPTAARKGAYELRDVARELDLEIVLLGRNLEAPNFWDGVRTRSGDGRIPDDAACVVQPALVEDAPRGLLAALALRIPVIATAACGLGIRPDCVEIPAGDRTALMRALRNVVRDDRANPCAPERAVL